MSWLDKEPCNKCFRAHSTNELQIYIVSIVLVLIGMEVEDKDVFSYDDEVITNADPHQGISIIYFHGLHSWDNRIVYSTGHKNDNRWHANARR